MLCKSKELGGEKKPRKTDILGLLAEEKAGLNF